MATFVNIDPTQKLDPFKSVKKLPLDEFFTSGHRTCQGCESALLMKMMAKAAGPRTIVSDRVVWPLAWARATASRGARVAPATAAPPSLKKDLRERPGMRIGSTHRSAIPACDKPLPGARPSETA